MLTTFLGVASLWLTWVHAQTRTPAHACGYTCRHQLLRAHIHPYCRGPGGRNRLLQCPLELGKG